MKHIYESEVLHKLMERDGFNIPSSVPPYESEIKAYLINQVKQAYPKLTDYEAEWLLYNYTKHLPADFPINSVSNVSTATFENVVPFAYQSAILKGNTILVNEENNEEKIEYEPFTLERGYFNLQTTNGVLTEITDDNFANSTTSWYTPVFNRCSAVMTFQSDAWDGFRIVYYDNEKKPIYVLKENDNPSNVLTLSTPLNAIYFRISTYADKTIRCVSNKDYLKLHSVKMPVLTTSNYKNLANDIFIDYGYISDGTIDNQKKWLISDFISIEPNVSYTTRSQGATNDGVFAIAFYDEDKTFISKKVSNSAISPTNAKFARINVRKSDGLDITEEEKNDTILYLEKTTEVLPFESHKTNILTVNEPVELRGIGDVKDELNCLTGEVTERIGEIVLDGSENWTKYEAYATNSDGYTSFVATIPSLNNFYDNNIPSFVGANFPTGTWNDYKADGARELVWNHDPNKIGIRVKNEKASNDEEIKSFLSTNNIRIVYKLAKESIKTVDLTTVNENGESVYFMPLEGTMNVSCSSQTINPTFDMSVPVEATTQNLASFINLEMEE